jgi:hypothetical protein
MFPLAGAVTVNPPATAWKVKGTYALRVGVGHGRRTIAVQPRSYHPRRKILR